MRKLKVLVACDESQEVCKAFRELGHIAFSCDLQECSGGHPEWHIQGDALNFLEPYDTGSGYAVTFYTQNGAWHEWYAQWYRDAWWDLIIAHPPCTDLAVSGARWFKEKQADGRQQKSIDFFMRFTQLDCQRVVIENPVCIMSRIYRKPDQIIQPWQFGHPVSKKTCLWIKGLPLLEPTDIVAPGKTDKYGFTDGAALQMARDENGKIISWNDPRTAKLRSRTFRGIAKAMAAQWSAYILNEEGDNNG